MQIVSRRNCYVYFLRVSIHVVNLLLLLLLYYCDRMSERLSGGTGFFIPFYLQAVQVHSANGVKLLEA
jgi:hypothetical protein